jgi:signal transduction histidine kinase
MLYLKPSCDTTGSASQPVSLGEQTALRLERALLCDDQAAKRGELVAAFQADRDVAGWAMRTAESRLGRTINRIDEAADWLCGCLEVELGAALTSQPPPSQPANGEARLAALVAKLSGYERRMTRFRERLERERLESLKELAYGASHEINNPLANIAARAQTLLVDERDTERRRKLVAIHRQAMRAHEMISDLMLFARPPKLNLVRCDLEELVGNVVDSSRAMASEYGIELVFAPAAKSIHLSADPTHVGVAIHALIVNALEALGDGGHVWIGMRETSIEGEAWAEIAVRDDGPGISDEVRRHMFDPFYSGREAGRGLGFGLSKCWRIVTDHGGQVVVQRPATGGAEIDVLLPLATRTAISSR